ncbi:MAG: hypothetical protein J1G38_04060 [Clostridiales bacterium]|nr:hypothetical protein [Clostridiales bacterium]
MKVFVSGSKRIDLPNCAFRTIDGYIERGYDFLVGDCHGVDKAVQQYLSESGVRNVTVYFSGISPRSNIGQWKVVALGNTELTGYDFYRLKDERMAADADCGLMIWNGESKGTAMNIDRLKSLKKSAEVIFVKSYEDVIATFVTRSVAYGAMYILPDGRMLDLSTLEYGHAEFCELLGKSPQELKESGWIRLNTKLKYVEKPGKITDAQADRLEETFAFMGERVPIK